VYTWFYSRRKCHISTCTYSICWCVFINLIDDFIHHFFIMFWHSQTPILILRSEEHTSELQSHSEISYAVFCLKTKKNTERNRSSAWPRSPATTRAKARAC